MDSDLDAEIDAAFKVIDLNTESGISSSLGNVHSKIHAIERSIEAFEKGS